MNKGVLKSSVLLLITSAIWGFAFVAQRVGMNYVGAFTFNGVRFGLGAFSLVPLIIFYKEKGKNKEKNKSFKSVFLSGLFTGLIVFLASSFQQVGLIGTTAGKAAFITGLYIVFVPIMGIFLKRHIGMSSWFGAVIAVIGLYFLCVTNNFSIAYSDLLELGSAFFFAIQIILIDIFSKKFDTLKLAFFQFITCSVLSLITATLFENITMNGILQAAIPILYGGIFSVGIAYTLQIIAQKNAEPTHAAIIMSMESVFAAIGGFLVLNEYLSLRAIFGCVLMLAGMTICQMRPRENCNAKVEACKKR